MLDVHGFVHRGGFVVRAFVGGDSGFVLKRRADIVEALQKNFFPRRRDLKLISQTVGVADGLAGQINGQRETRGTLDAPEEFADLLLRQGRRENAVLEAIVIEDIGVTWRENDAKSVVLDGPGRVLAARTAAEIGPREQD